jgi:hypothetical protein
VNYDHIKGKDTLLIQNVLNTTDSLLAEYISTTRKPIEVISTYLLYDTSILTQLAKKSIALNPTFQISILAIQLKCISNLFKKNSPENSDFFKYWRNANGQIKDKLLSKIDSYSVHQEYFYLQKNHPESQLKPIINKYFNTLREIAIFENQDTEIELKTSIENRLSNSQLYTDEYLQNIKKELLRINQLETSDGKTLIPSTSELRSLFSANNVKNKKIEYEYFNIASKTLDFLERTEVKIFQTESDLAASDNTTTINDHINQLCNLTKVFNYVYLLIVKLQECTLADDLLSFQTIANSLGKLEILNTHYEDSMLNKLDSLIGLNQKNNDQLSQLIEYAQEISESIKQTSQNLIAIGKSIEILEYSLNQTFKHSLKMIDFSIQSGFSLINKQIQDLNSKVNLQTLISSVNYYKDSKIQISINRELTKL